MPLKDLLTTYWPVVVVIGGALLGAVGFSVRVDSGIRHISAEQSEMRQDIKELQKSIFTGDQARDIHKDLSDRIYALERSK